MTDTRFPLDFEGLLYERTDGLFENEVVAEFEGAHCVAVMVAVLRGDNHSVGDFALREKLLVAGETLVFGHVPLAFDLVDFVAVLVADGNNPYVGIAGQMSPVIFAAASEPQYGDSDHNSPLRRLCRGIRLERARTRKSVH